MSSLRTDWSQNSSNVFDKDLQSFLKETGQDKLSQSKVLVNVLAHLVDNKHIEEAYFRGSFSYGNADEYSDIDLFTVVEPEKLENTFDSIVNYLEENYPIVILCHDNRVADYGGIGFMFLCEYPEKEPFQLDVYIALKGVKPKAPLVDSPRIYSESDYCWLSDYRKNNEDLIPSVKKFIESYTNNSSVKEKLRHSYEELMVTLFVMSKHIKRGQFARTISDHQAAFDSSVQLLKVATGEETHQSSEYFADKLIEKYEGVSKQSIAESIAILKSVIDSPNDDQKVFSYMRLANSLIQENFPELADKMQNQIGRVDYLINSQFPSTEKKSGGEKQWQPKYNNNGVWLCLWSTSYRRVLGGLRF